MLHTTPSLVKVTDEYKARLYGLEIGQVAFVEYGVTYPRGKYPYVVEALPHRTNGPFFIVCTPGHTGWCSMGETSYYETRYALLENTGKRTEHGGWKSHKECSYGRLWKQGIKELKKEAAAIMRGTTLAEEEEKKDALNYNLEQIKIMQDQVLALEVKQQGLLDTTDTLSSALTEFAAARRKLDSSIRQLEDKHRTKRQELTKNAEELEKIKRIFKLREEK